EVLSQLLLRLSHLALHELLRRAAPRQHDGGDQTPRERPPSAHGSSSARPHPGPARRTVYRVAAGAETPPPPQGREAAGPDLCGPGARYESEGNRAGGAGRPAGMPAARGIPRSPRTTTGSAAGARAAGAGSATGRAVSRFPGAAAMRGGAGRETGALAAEGAAGCGSRCVASVAGPPGRGFAGGRAAPGGLVPGGNAAAPRPGIGVTSREARGHWPRATVPGCAMLGGADGGGTGRAGRRAASLPGAVVDGAGGAPAGGVDGGVTGGAFRRIAGSAGPPAAPGDPIVPSGCARRPAGSSRGPPAEPSKASVASRGPRWATGSSTRARPRERGVASPRGGGGETAGRAASLRVPPPGPGAGTPGDAGGVDALTSAPDRPGRPTSRVGRSDGITARPWARSSGVQSLGGRVATTGRVWMPAGGFTAGPGAGTTLAGTGRIPTAPCAGASARACCRGMCAAWTRPRPNCAAGTPTTASLTWTWR